MSAMRAADAAAAAGDARGEHPRARRLRAPLLIALAAVLALEAVGGLVIFFARLTIDRTPGEELHVAGGLVLSVVYIVYQIQHWVRVEPFRARLDYALGLIAALSLVATNALGAGLGWIWYTSRVAGVSPVPYPALMSAAHNITSMLVLTFVLAHLMAVLARDRKPLSRQNGS
jgi:hypothetical protein